MNQFAYHFKPAKMVESHLIPLNRLREKFPAVYIEEVQKYEGREDFLQFKIPILDCLWNDVLHLSPLNPQVLLDAWRKEGLYEYAGASTPFEVYRIPVDLLQDGATACYQSFNFDFDNYSPDLEKYWLFQKSSFVEQKAVDPKQLEMWKADFENSRPLFWYSHTMHILVQHEIDTRECEVFLCK